MKYTLLLSILIFFATVLDASYARSIRINSYIHESDAKEALKELEIFINNNQKLSQYQNELGFNIKTIKTGKYYMLDMRPFIDRQIVQKTLDILRTEYKYVYPRKIAYKSSFENVSESYEEEQDQKEPVIDRTRLITKIDTLLQETDSTQDIEKNIVTKVQVNKKTSVDYPQLPLNLPMLKYTYYNDKNSLTSEEKIAINDKNNSELTIFKEYIIEMVVFAGIVILLLLIIIFYRFRKKRENKITIQEIYT